MMTHIVLDCPNCGHEVYFSSRNLPAFKLEAQEKLGEGVIIESKDPVSCGGCGDRLSIRARVVVMAGEMI